ncbi:MAG: SpoIID/LytB domain-containing protein [Elusimicrobia bacterium]|nr:SpoIID/LytB domain-containing protein [Elusimicrobiota bacterium]
MRNFLLGAALLFTLSPRADASADELVAQGNAFYFQGQQPKALDRYGKALEESSTTVKAWLNGGVVLEELGNPKKAAEWFRRAARISAEEPEVLTAMGWARWRAGDFEGASAALYEAARRDPEAAYAWLGLARAELDLGLPKKALEALDKAQAAAPLLNLVSYYQGQASEKMGNTAKASEAYRRAVLADSYFVEGRDPLARAYFKQKDYNQAWRQLSKILDAEPLSRRFTAWLKKVRPRLTRRPADILTPSGLHRPEPYIVDSDSGGASVPKLRINIGSTALGKPRPRQFLKFEATTSFLVVDASSGKKLLKGETGEAWQARIRRGKKGALLALHDSSGRSMLQRRQAVVVRPQSPKGLIAVDGKLLRGVVEISPFKGRLRIVNALDLENYTHGVVAAEMPIGSPLEALKAQAVIARSHALFIQKISRRHRREGYDLCDDQHCQVYAGVRAESQRSREVVEATRGRIAVFNGKVAHVIYSSNCGGHTQNGSDLTGWGDVSYWSSIPDGQGLPATVDSPWELRRWLLGWPAAFCKPSNYAHPSHFRWTRIIPFKDLEEKIARRYKTGKLLSLRVLRRSASGNVNAILIQGSQRKVKIDSEMQIRNLLGIGSLRSTLFIVDAEYKKGAARPETLVFHGGGWGHAVGLCQSGAMGRAEAGQSYEEIIKAYFKGVELGQMDY